MREPPPEKPIVIAPKCRLCRKRPRMNGHRECEQCAAVRMQIMGANDA
jgi:hypothetical protein